MATMLRSGDSPRLANLRASLRRLNAYEQRWIDLTYPAGDPRAVIPDDEIDQYAIDERDRLRRDVVRLAALVAGETSDAANMFADTPRRLDNPYSVDRVRLALSLRWSIDVPTYTIVQPARAVPLAPGEAPDWRVMQQSGRNYGTIIAARFDDRVFAERWIAERKPGAAL